MRLRKGLFHAHTEGALRSGKSQNVMGILEVKSRMRHNDKDSILMQEGTEMVGLLLSKNPNIFPNNQ
jgi:hypothetical protein